MKKAFIVIAWFIFISINIIQLSSLPVYSLFKIADRPIFTYFLYLSYILSIFVWIVILFKKQKFDRILPEFLLISIYLFYMIYSLLMRASITDLIIESSIYVTMISIYVFSKYLSTKFNKLLLIYYITVIILSIVALFSSLGYLSGIGSSDFLRSSIDADGNNGVFGLTLGLYGYFLGKNKKIRITAIFTVFAAIIILITGMSRTRIIISVMSVLLIFGYQFIKVRKIKFFTRFTFLIVLSFILSYIFREYIGDFSSLIISRFSNLDNDFNIIYRLNEIRAHIELWAKSPLFGHGWTGLTTDYLGYRIYDHNSYSALLALLGIFGSLIYFSWFLVMFFKLMDKLKYNTKPLTYVGLLIFMQILLLGYANMGFGKSSSIIGILFCYMIINRKEEQNNA